MKRQAQAVLVVTGLTVATMVGPVGRAYAAEQTKPRRVAVFTLTLDAMKSGAKAGPSVGFGVVLSVLTLAVPPPGQFAPIDPVTQPLQQQFGAQGAAAVAQFSQSSQDGVTRLQQGIEPLAVLNPAINAGLDAMSGGAEGLADGPAGPAVQPGDRSMRQFAALMRNFKEAQ